MLPKEEFQTFDFKGAFQELNSKIFEKTDHKFDLGNFIQLNTFRGGGETIGMRTHILAEARGAMDDDTRKQIEELLKIIPKDGDPNLANGLKKLLIRNLLYIGSECERLSEINIDEEYDMLNAVLQSEFMVMIRTPNPTFGDLLDAWEKHKPSVLLFSCHGDKFGLYLQDEAGKCKHYPTTTFIEFFKWRSKATECVVLSACESADVGKNLIDYIPNVIMINKKVNIETAKTFNKRLIKYLNDYSNLDSSIYENAFNYAFEFVRGELLPDSFSFIYQKSKIKQ